MTRNAGNRRRAFVERQFVLQQERSAGSVAAAAEALRRACPADCRGEIDRLEAELSGGATTSAAGREAVMAVVAAARGRGGAPLATYASFQKVHVMGQQSLEGFLGGIGSQVQYLLILLFVLVCVAMTYSVFVYPALTGIYDSFGMYGDGLSTLLFGRVRLIWVLIVLAAVVVLAARSLVVRLRRRLQTGAAMTERMVAWPIIGEVVRSQRRWLALQWMVALGDGGVGWAAARELTRAQFGILADLDGGTLEAAEALGTLRPELLAQIELRQAEALKSVTRARTVLVYVIRVVVYLVIAIAVLGMYGPIFGLGAIG